VRAGIDTGDRFDVGGNTIDLTARIDNLANIRYIGAMIVNDSRGRYFEPGSGRSFMLGARVTF
jgi:iron complex outermembrane receptor protein